MKNKDVREQLYELYGRRCLLTNLRDKGKLSFHHIRKKENGYGESLDNGAMLNRTIHDYIHNEIELHDLDLFILINECLQLYKKCIDGGLEELINEYESEIMPIYYKKYLAYQSRRRR